MAQPTQYPTKHDQIMTSLGKLALAKNQGVEVAVIETYAELLDPYPLAAIRGAITTLGLDTSRFFPPVGVIAIEGGEGGPSPALLVAVTVKV